MFYTNTGGIIETKNNVKDLGVILSSSMTYDVHIQNQIQRVKSISAWIYRTFQSRDIDLMLTLWKSLVIPHLDYCSQLWSPSKRSLQQDLEALQKSFLNGIPSIRKLNYWEKLKKVKMYSLERRRERYRIIYTWCILEGLVPNFNYDEGKGGIYSYINQRLGRLCSLKPVKLGHKNIWKGSLSEEGPKLFNILPKSLRNTSKCAKDIFKRKLDNFLQTVPDEPLLPNYFPFRRADSNSIIEMVKHRTPKLDAW